MEISKLFANDIERNENYPIVQWMEFLDAKSKVVTELLAENLLRMRLKVEQV